MSKPASTITVALLQHSCTANAEQNLYTIQAQIEAAVAKGAELILLQELHNGLYFCQTEATDNFELAEPIPGPSTQRLGELAAKHNIVLVRAEPPSSSR